MNRILIATLSLCLLAWPAAAQEGMNARDMTAPAKKAPAKAKKKAKGKAKGKAKAKGPGSVSAVVEMVDPEAGTLSLKGYDGKEWSLPSAAGVAITKGADKKALKLSDLKEGDKVRVFETAGKVTAIQVKARPKGKKPARK